MCVGTPSAAAGVGSLGELQTGCTGRWARASTLPPVSDRNPAASADPTTLSAVQRNAVAELLRIAPVADRLAELFDEAGHQLHLVGGSVRDALMGRLGEDLDFTTSARPDEIERLLRRLTPAVWDVGKAFGTIGARVSRDDGPDWIIEITTYRADTYRDDSRKPEVAFGDTLEGDLIRRDFTVNAMAITLGSRTFVDPHHGLGDLAAGVLRTPSAPEVSFSDDPLRMMRAARFTSQLSSGEQRFAPDAAAVAAMVNMAERIEIISAERVRDELCKLLLTDSPRPGINLLVETGIAERVLPELPAMRLERDEHHRHKDVYEHSLTVLDQAIDIERARGHEPDLVSRLAALLHDIGKPATRKFEPGGKVSFHHHDVVGAKMTRKRMKALRFSSEEIAQVSKLVELHLRFHGYGEAKWTDSAVRRYVRDAGDQLERLHILTRADCTTRNNRKAARLRRAYDDLEARIDELAAQEELDAMRPDLNGEEIMEILDIKPSKTVGEAYRHLLDLRMEHGPLGRERAEEELRRWWAEQP
ncbi:poly(A) polymerase [Propioniferax innocua]|uniref:Poly(A) polymerase n=1 Tax=Propioniferax innocua TaxID=1753 RepID=A0A542ZDJ7_9ACTN|nr:poly(A) polymerase [Propioniferax innocua]